MTTTTKAKATAQKAAADIESAFDAFNMNLPTLDVPAAFRDASEKAVAQAKDAYAKIKGAYEDASDVIEETYEQTRGAALTVGLKAIENTKTNADASFAFYKDLIGAKTFADALELQTSFARKQFDAFAGQVKEFQEVAQKAALDATKPAKAAFEKAFKDYKVA